MIKAILFDFDGVIANTEPLHARAVSRIFKHMKLPVTEQDIHEAIGTPDPDFFKKMLKKYKGIEDPDIIENMLIKKRAAYMEIALAEVEPLPGVKEMLTETLALPKAIATTCSRQTIKPLLQKMDITHFFEAIVGYYEVENKKPHGEPYEKAAAELGMKPGECLAFEDSPSGTQSAINAGCITCGVLTNFEEEDLPGCKYYLKNFADTSKVIELIKSMP